MPAEGDKRDKAYQPCYFADDQLDQHGFARHQSRATAFQQFPQMDDPFVDPPQDNPFSTPQGQAGSSSAHRQGSSGGPYPIWPLMNEGPQMRYNGWGARAVPAVTHWPGTHSSQGPNLYPPGNNPYRGFRGPAQQSGAFNAAPSVTMPIPPPNTAKRPAPEDSPTRSAEDKFARMRNKRRKMENLEESLETEIGQNDLLRRENEQLKHENAHHKAFIESGTSEVARLLQENAALKTQNAALKTQMWDMRMEFDKQNEERERQEKARNEALQLKAAREIEAVKRKEKAKMKALQRDAVMKIEAIKGRMYRENEDLLEKLGNLLEALDEACAEEA